MQVHNGADHFGNVIKHGIIEATKTTTKTF